MYNQSCLKRILTKKSSHFPKLAKLLAFCLVAFFSTEKIEAQNRTTGGGGKTPNTDDNRTISQFGDNKAFPSGKNSTSHNSTIDKSRKEKKAIKLKQEMSSKFRGNDVRKKHPHHVNPKDESERGGNTGATDHSNYNDKREDQMKMKEKPHDKHNFQGNEMVNPKFIKFGAPLNVDHVNQESPIVDYSKFKDYRKKAFEKHEKTMLHINSEGSAQYGKRPSGEFVDLNERRALRSSKDKEQFSYTGDVSNEKKEADLRTKEKEIAHNSGDMDLSARDKSRRQKEKEIANFSGNLEGGDRDEMRQLKHEEMTNNSGDLEYISQKENYRKKQKETANYSGDLQANSTEDMRRKKDKETANYSGNMVLEDKEGIIRQKQKEIANNTGDIDLTARNDMRREKEKEIATYSGDISTHNLLKKAKEIRQKEKTIANYSGDILVKTLRERDNRIRMKAKKIADWEGDIIITRKMKGAHPSAAYAGGKIANSYKEKEKYRRQMLKKYGRNSDLETPNYERKKQEKPTYDKNEGKIWDVQNYRETKIKEAP
jgi:hypothetical protein